MLSKVYLNQGVQMTISNAIAPADAKYNNWTNIWTWLVVTHMTEDPEMYSFLHDICTPSPDLPKAEVRMAKQDAKYAFREYLEGIWSRIVVGQTLGAGYHQTNIMSDLLTGAFDRVNFLEIIEVHWGKN